MSEGPMSYELVLSRLYETTKRNSREISEIQKTLHELNKADMLLHQNLLELFGVMRTLLSAIPSGGERIERENQSNSENRGQGPGPDDPAILDTHSG